MLRSVFPVGLVLSLLLSATVALGQSSGLSDGFFLNGYAEVGAADVTNRSRSYYRADIDLGFRPSSGSGLGAILGIDSFGNHGFHPNALYPALTYDSFIGSFSLGNPRSVIDQGYAPGSIFGNATRLDTSFDLVFGSAVKSGLWLDGDAYGLRYDGALGNALIGVSAHRIHVGGADRNSYALAFRTPLALLNDRYGKLAVFGSFERVEGSGSGRIGYTLGAEAQLKKLHGVLRYRKSSLVPRGKLLEGLLDYAMTEQLKISLGLAHSSGPSNANFYALGAQYDLFQNAYIKGSVMDDSTSGSDPSLDIAVGFRF